MSGTGFLRVKKLKPDSIILKAARHNKREIQAELGAEGSIDPTRSSLNYSLVGPSTATAVAALAKDLMAAAGVGKLRKDAVLGIEVVSSLPVGHQLDTQAYFADCLAWAGGYFGGAANVLSADVHLDEAADHLHILILPLVDGRMQGHALCGGPKDVLAMQKQFHETVAKRFGLGKAPVRLSGAGKQAAAAMVLGSLRKANDAALQSAVWATMRDLIESAPEPFLVALGITLEPKAKKLKSFVEYVVSTGKGPKREAREINALSFVGTKEGNAISSVEAEKTGAEKTQPICSVSFQKSTAYFQPPKDPFDARPAVVPGIQQQSSLSGTERPLSDIPDEHGEIAAPAPMTTTTTHQPDKDGERVIDGGVRIEPSSDIQATKVATTATDEATVRDHLRTQPNADDHHQESRKATETTRERDEDNESGHWCSDTGEFVIGPSGATKPAKRAMRDAADSLVAAGLAARGKMATKYTVRL